MEEKLIELLRNGILAAINDDGRYLYADVVDYMIAHGMIVPVLCKECKHGSHVDCPEGRVWCDKMCRYMGFEGYCSYGERRKNGK